MIHKIDDLTYEREFASTCEDLMNESHDIEFTEEGLRIDYDILDWDAIKTAYRKLHKTETIEIKPVDFY